MKHMTLIVLFVILVCVSVTMAQGLMNNINILKYLKQLQERFKRVG